MLTSKEFNEVSSLQLRHMRERFAEKVSAKGRVLRIGREVPFELPEFRLWLQARLDQQQYACCYCGRQLTRKNITIDHAFPVKRGGGLGFDNLAVACQDCNRIKSDLSPTAFKALMKGLQTFPSEDRNNILKRLRAGAMGMRLRFFKPVDKQPEAQPMTQEEF